MLIIDFTHGKRSGDCVCTVLIVHNDWNADVYKPNRAIVNIGIAHLVGKLGGEAQAAAALCDQTTYLRNAG